ncbi:MAG: DUF2442 domain-containing protein [Armatimonadetes bacterium]|nr:DUF2442 domain-containing protein [Armatimonadota bacterium]
MTSDIVSASYRGGYEIEIAFADGQRGVVDFSRYLARRGVFARFRDQAFFRAFQVNEELGVLTWEDEIDIAPETLYAQATGTPLPAWMTEAEADEGEHVETALALGMKV